MRRPQSPVSPALGPRWEGGAHRYGRRQSPDTVGTVQARELWVTGTFRYANTWPTALDLVTSGVVDVDRLVTGHFKLADTVEALLAGQTRSHAVKSVINPQA